MNTAERKDSLSLCKIERARSYTDTRKGSELLRDTRTHVSKFPKYDTNIEDAIMTNLIFLHVQSMLQFGTQFSSSFSC